MEQQWISVKDRLPEIDRHVLITDGETIVTAHVYQLEEWGACWTSSGFGGYEWEWDFDIAAVTHWMPLPERPKE